MNNKILGIILAAVVIATAVFVFKKPSNQNAAIESEVESVENLAAGAAAPHEQLVAINSSVDSSAASSSGASTAQAETYEQKLIKQGYVQDPNNPNQMIKQVIDKEGKKHTYSVDKTDEGFGPDARTVKNALETLESKRNADPFEEVRTLKRINEDNINSAMLNGSFRDEANDIECTFSSVTDEKGNPQDYDQACFVAPKLGLNFVSAYDKYTVNTDETGYAIVKFSPTKFVRITWSYEHKRVLHGEVISIENGQSKTIKSFAAAQISRSKGEELKYCK